MECTCAMVYNAPRTKRKGLKSMTVKDMVGVIKTAEEVHLTWDGQRVVFNSADPVMLDAFGAYQVGEVTAVKEDCFEIALTMRPVKELER